jgi:hypothetical protein
MNSDLTNLQGHIRSAELRRRAELHRLAVTARASERGARPPRPSRRHLGSLGSPTNVVRTTVARIGAAFAALR